MRINLHIERLVLDGVPLDRHMTPLLEQAVQAELMRLLAQEKSPATALVSGATPALRGEAIRTEPAMSPLRLGNAVAQSVHGAIRT